jgi:hypothetical protein
VLGSLRLPFRGIAASVDRQRFDEGRPAMNTALPRHARAIAAEASCSAEAIENPDPQLPAGVEELTAGWTANATGSRNRDLPAFARPL